jgi:hypothetical protein
MTGVRRWPLFLIAAPAAVAIWSGWVGLGELCGFGPVRVLPGISDVTINTAITLPIGVEAYAAYALGAWMSPGSPAGARRFARWSALGALAYGMAGQIIYHLLAVGQATAAPWPVVVVVSCMPVAVLGLAAALTHLLRQPTEMRHDVPASAPVFTDSQTAARAALATSIAGGNALSQNQLMTRFRLTRAQATKVRQAVLSSSPAGASAAPPAPGPPAGVSPNGHQPAEGR